MNNTIRGWLGFSLVVISYIIWFNFIEDDKSSFYKDRIATIIEKTSPSYNYKGRELHHYYIKYYWVEDGISYTRNEYNNEWFYNNHNVGDIVNDRIEDESKDMGQWFVLLCVVSLIGMIMLSVSLSEELL